jgi:hypothetical protein
VATVPSASTPSRCVTSAGPRIGISLYLVSVGFVAAATVAIFFGSAFLLLTQPMGQLQTDISTHGRNTKVNSMRSTDPLAGADIAQSSSLEVPTRSSMVGETTIIASAQAAEPSEPAPSLGPPFVPTPSPTAGEATVPLPAQIAAQSEPAASSRSASVPPARGAESDHLRKLSRPLHLRSDRIPSEARAAAGRIRSARQDRIRDSEDGAAASANQHEYNQLHETGPGVALSSVAPSH